MNIFLTEEKSCEDGQRLKREEKEGREGKVGVQIDIVTSRHCIRSVITAEVLINVTSNNCTVMIVR